MKQLKTIKEQKIYNKQKAEVQRLENSLQQIYVEISRLAAKKA